MYAGFEKALEAAVASGRIAGAVAAVADRDGVTYTRQAGVRQAGVPAAMTQDTIFWLASMTKAVVSVAALREVEAGRLSLDGDLSGLLPEFANLQVLEGFGEDGTPRLRPAPRAPTLRDLLTHTSGFGYAFLSADLTRWHQVTGAADPNGGTRSAHVLPLLHDPGEAWSYGIGIDWAGLAVEAASGQRLDAYLNDHILGPLGMTDTGFAPVDPERRATAGTTELGLVAGMNTSTSAANDSGFVNSTGANSTGANATGAVSAFCPGVSRQLTQATLPSPPQVPACTRARSATCRYLRRSGRWRRLGWSQ